MCRLKKFSVNSGRSVISFCGVIIRRATAGLNREVFHLRVVLTVVGESGRGAIGGWVVGGGHVGAAEPPLEEIMRRHIARGIHGEAVRGSNPGSTQQAERDRSSVPVQVPQRRSSLLGKWIWVGRLKWFPEMEPGISFDYVILESGNLRKVKSSWVQSQAASTWSLLKTQ